MVNPLKYRPLDPEEEDWSDNAVSNAMAWASKLLVKNWCHKENHWTGKLSNYLWTLCPCCLLLRGFFLGVFVTSFIATLI